jgi:hypothetical protein
MRTREESWLQTARRAEIVRSAGKVSLVVGTLLLVINQADALLSGGSSKGMIVKIRLTYSVPLLRLDLRGGAGAEKLSVTRPPLRPSQSTPGRGASSAEIWRAPQSLGLIIVENCFPIP